MLARLDAVPGLAPARVDASGRFFWVAPAGGDASAAADRAREVLGATARTLSPSEAEAQLAAHVRGDPWLGAAEVMALSYVEGRLLSVRIAGAAARELGAAAPAREAVAEAIRVELFRALERVHAEGGRRSSSWIDAEWPEIARAAAARCRDVLEPERHALLVTLLPSLLRA
ncbi:MAG TPA: hypothetical protein VFM53_15435 [Anaeromyxobacteraceae bacterium]|nr:hypothetical protein [Anaeromyxobacteraceae bacterium]